MQEDSETDAADFFNEDLFVNSRFATLHIECIFFFLFCEHAVKMAYYQPIAFYVRLPLGTEFVKDIDATVNKKCSHKFTTQVTDEWLPSSRMTQ